MALILIFEFILALNLSFYLVYGLASNFRYSPKKKPLIIKEPFSFLVVVPAYKEDEILLETCKHNLKVLKEQNLDFEILVLAQLNTQETIVQLRNWGIQVLDIHVGEVHSKLIAMKQAVETFDHGNFSAVVVMDVDNRFSNKSLALYNDSLSRGFKVVQAKRKGYMNNSPLSWQDDMNEAIMHNFYRKGHRVLGLSSSLSGTGMCFESSIYTDMIRAIPNAAGEDKFMELYLSRNRFKIEFREDNHIYEHKTDAPKEFVKQRTRWFTAQYYAFFKHFLPATSQLIIHGNFGYFEKMFQFGLIPKGILMLLFGLNLIITPFVGFYWFVLACLLFSLFALSMFMAMPNEYRNLETFKHFGSIPGTILLQLKAFASMSPSKTKKFEVTNKKR